MASYKDVTFNPEMNKISGLSSITADGEPECRFTASLNLFAIMLAMDLKPSSIADFMNMADGYGERGYFPGGYDWSGIRDSSKESVTEMFCHARVILQGYEVQLKNMGFPEDLCKALVGRKYGIKPKRTRKMKLKVFGGHLDGRTRVIVACTSIAECAKLTGSSYYYIETMWSVTGNEEEIKVAMANPGKVIESPVQ